MTSSPVERHCAHLDPAVAEQMKDIRQLAQSRTGQEDKLIKGRRLGPSRYSPTAKQFEPDAQVTPLKLL